MKSTNLIYLDDNADRKTIGNKGYNLTQMHKLGIRIPKTIFLGTEQCKHIFKSGIVPTFPIISQLKCNKIAIRSSGVVSMAGMMDTILNVDKDDEQAVSGAIFSIVMSWDSDRAKAYRKLFSISEEPQIAIVIQEMIDPAKGYSGICFSRDVVNGDSKITGEYVEHTFGDALAQGNVTPKKIDSEFYESNDRLMNELIETALKLERHFKDVQDMEFVYDGSDLYFVQTRKAQLSPLARIKTLISFLEEGIIKKDEFLKRFNPRHVIHGHQITASGAPFLFNGTPAVSGWFVGQVTFSRDKTDSSKVLILKTTTPDDIEYIERSGAIITQEGGFSSHPAVICRQLNKPCIVGAPIDIDFVNGLATINKSGAEFDEGDTITIVGTTGDVYFGKAMINEDNVLENKIKIILGTNF